MSKRTGPLDNRKLSYKARMGIKNCIYLLQVASWDGLSDDEKRHTHETLVLLKELYNIAEQPGPAFLREEVSPQEWRETSSTGRERAGQICQKDAKVRDDRKISKDKG